MKEWDAFTINDVGIPSLVLMERASLAIADEAEKLVGSDRSRRILSVCGTGNNGGDGAAAARILRERGYQADIFLTGDRARFSREMGTQIAIAEKLGIPVLDSAFPSLNDYELIIDAVFGIGLKRDVEDQDLFALINRSGLKVLSADIPSGVSADTGAVMGSAIKADVTVTMQAAKTGHLMYPGASLCGRLVIADIGIHPLKDRLTARFLEDEDLTRIPERNPDGNKGTFGKVLVIAGSKNMSGASYLTCLSALRTGCGMVKLLTTEANRVIIQETLPEVMLETFEGSDEAVEKLKAALKWADVIACGPGLGTAETAEILVRTLLRETDRPLVLDADALNIVSKEPEMMTGTKSPIIITPHPGEMSRLTKRPIPEITGDLIGNALTFSRKYHLTCLLKDARTVIACEDGSVYINTTGNSGMATAGSGDVLTGIAAGLIARGLLPSKAGPLAAYIHGKAGDIASAKTGPSAVTATLLIASLPKALGEI